MQVPGTDRAEFAPAAPRPVGSCRAVAALMLLGGLAGWCNLAEGAAGTVLRRSAKGLTVQIDTVWGDGFGYRPARITVTPIGLPLADRTLTVEFLVRRQWNQEYDLRVAEEIEIPAGSRGVEATLSVPHLLPWSMCKINVFEDGELQEKLSTNWNQASNASPEAGENLPVILIVGDQLPDTTRLAMPLPVDNYSQYGPYTRSVQSLPGLPTAFARRAADLSQAWIDYSSLDVVCLSLDQLAELKSDYSEVHRAVLRWTAAGGNLWVYGVGQDGEKLGELERLVDLPRGLSDGSDPAARGWIEPKDRDRQRLLTGTWSGEYGGEVYVGPYGERMVTRSRKQIRPSRDVDPTRRAPHFRLHEYNMGLIVALAPENPFPGTPTDWGWVLNSVGSDRCLWYQRHGFSLVRQNPDHWKFLIPGVGLAPVTEFCVLITLFVLGIGPLNYWLFRRWKRLHLLVVTIPASAVIVTFLLFAYAMVADGLGTRVRVRSITHLDQRRKQAVCWSRLSYYAGLAPRRGLSFPKDVVVLPLEETPETRYRAQPRRRELLWEEHQWLASGWLHSRTPTQFVTLRSRSTDRRLELIGGDGTTGELKVKNRLGTRIHQLVVCPDKGEYRYCWATDIREDETKVLTPITPVEVRKRLGKTWNDHQLKLPEDMDGRRQGSIFGFSRRYYYGPRWSRGRSLPPSQNTGRLERSLAGAGLGSLAPGSYVAVVQQSPEVVLGTPVARQEASFHVIFGKW